MSTERTITVKAADGVLTMAELRAFVAEFDQAADGAADADGQVRLLKVKARVSFGGGIKSVTVTVPDGNTGRA